MIRRFKSIRPGPLLLHLAVTLAYPVLKTCLASANRLQVFSDVLAIVGLMLLALGVLYSMFLRGDFDVSAYLLLRGLHKTGGQSFEAYWADRKERREEAFNYPLFSGLAYLLVSAVIAYGVL